MMRPSATSENGKNNHAADEFRQGLRVALMNVVLEGDYQYEQEMPLGLAHVGAFLRQKGYAVIFQQCFASRGAEQITAAADVEADVYGFQLNMVNYQPVRAVVQTIKSRNPQAVIVLGGPFLVSLSQELLKNEPLFDFAVIGEGEYTLLELLPALEKGEKDFRNCLGLVWRDLEGRVIQNGMREMVADLDSLPFPARDFLEEAKRDPVDNTILESVRVVTSRGCVGQCSFCCVNLYNKVQKGKIWRGRSPQHVVDELETLARVYQARLFNFADSSFEDPGEVGKRRSQDICEEIIRRQLPVSIKIYLRCETMKSPADIELLKFYKRAGIDVIIPGVESMAGGELKFYGKRATVEDNYRTARMLRDLGVFFVFPGFIMFGPNSTEETIQRNIQFLREFDYDYNLMTVANVLSLFRDSRMYKQLKSEGRVIDPGHYWELPKYKIQDPFAGRLSQHWENTLVRYPDTGPVNKLQVNLGNLVARMTNPMHANLLEALSDEYLELKAQYRRLNSEFGAYQSSYFQHTMALVKRDCPAEDLDAGGQDFFGGTYHRYRQLYEQLYERFLARVRSAGFSLSGLVFKHYTSAIMIENTERVENRV